MVGVRMGCKSPDGGIVIGSQVDVDAALGGTHSVDVRLGVMLGGTSPASVCACTCGEVTRLSCRTGGCALEFNPVNHKIAGAARDTEQHDGKQVLVYRCCAGYVVQRVSPIVTGAF